ncbi:MAG TPA: CYTH domain-containing protein [Vicinamibacterales bacterium]|nr:CYTH domain-containing protein [Vicinamibacterales bacterium]
MAREIERKFLVIGTAWMAGANGVRFRQGYLSTVKERTVRVRVEGERALLTIKGPTVGVSRLEFEYPIPVPDAERMLDALCERPLVEKTRYRIPIGSHVWEIDEFAGDNEGLVVAEIELAAPDEPFERPAWIGREVSDDPRYFNANLVRAPYRTWTDAGGGGQ